MIDTLRQHHPLIIEGMITLGPSESSGRPNLRFSDSLHQSIRDYGESTRPLAQSTGSSIANLLGSSPVQGKSAAQKKIETIQLIEELYKQGTISKQQAEKLKAEAINN